MKRLFPLAALLFVSPAMGQPDAATVLRKKFENCVYDEVGVQWKASPRISPNLATETAFQACSTEEQAIVSLMMAMNTDSGRASAALSGLKLRIKSTVREIMTDPAKYMRERGR